MLPVPPCIPGLVGCDDTSDATSGTFGGSSNGGSSGFGGSSGTSSRSSGSTGFSVNGGGSIDASGLRNGIQNGLNSAGNGASALGGALGSAGSNLASGVRTAGSNLANGVGSAASAATKKAQRYAQYLITATNRGKDAVKGFSFTHGPLPFGAEFDPSRSSPECTQVGTAVQCTSDLAPGEKKDFTLAYKAGNSFSCAIARALQSVKSAAASLTGSSSSNVTTSVNCSMKTVSGAQSSGTGSSAVNQGQSGANGYGAGGTMASSSGAFAGAGLQGSILGTDALNGTGNGSKKGYKPYDGVRMPRTGAGDFFAGSRTDYVLLPVHQADQSYGFIAYSEAFFIVVLVLAVFRLVKTKVFG